MTQRSAWRGLLFVLLLPLLANGQDERPPVTRTYFINNAFIVPEPGKVIDLGGVVIRDGLIEAVGKGLRAPVDAKVMEGDSLYVYAGFINGLSHVGVPKPKEETTRPKVDDPGNPPRHVSGIQPERSVTDMLKADDSSVSDLRKIGFTTAHVVPYGKMLPGRGAIIQLHGDAAGEMVLRESTSLFAQFTGAGGRNYPSTTLAIMAKWRELYARARQGREHATRYATAPRGMTRPQHDEMLEAFYPTLTGEQPVFFAVDDIKEMHRALGLAEELDFPLALANVSRAHLMLDRLADGKTPVFLRLDLPEAKDKKEEKKEEESKEKPINAPQEAAEDKPDNLENTVKVKQEERRVAAMRQFEEQAAELAKAGVPFGFSTLEVKSKDIRENLRRMIKAGLSEDQALAALTSNPAKLLGLSDVLGTVEKGKIANLVVTDKPYFAEKSNVRYVFVDGTPTEYEVKKKKEKKPGDPDAEVNALGSWSLAIDAPVETPPMTLVLTGSNDDLSGVLTGMGGDTQINDLELDGDNLVFSVKVSFSGAALPLAFDLTLDGDDVEGTVVAGSYGTFDVEGSRKDPE